MGKPSKLTAAAMIAAKSELFTDMPNDAALAELRAILAHNDQSINRNRRIGAEAVVGLLAAHGWIGGRARLDRVCRALGRKSFGTP